MNKYSNVNNIIFGTNEDGDEVIDKLKTTLDTYGSVSVADLYDLSGLPYTYKDNKYGWTDLSSVKLVPCEYGYQLQIDEPKAFK
jgi:hypothetical protein